MEHGGVLLLRCAPDIHSGPEDSADVRGDRAAQHLAAWNFVH